MKTVSVTEMGKEEKDLIIAIRNYATVSKIPLKKVIKEMTEDLEDLTDAKIGEEAYEDYLKNPKTYTHEEVLKELGLK